MGECLGAQAVCKTAAFAHEGSNPSPRAFIRGKILTIPFPPYRYSIVNLMRTKKACACGETDSTKFQRIRRGSKTYLLGTCTPCLNAARLTKNASNLRHTRAVGRRAYERQKEQRRQGLNTEKFIYQDSRRTDRKAGRSNDLTKDFIAEQIAKGCAYCGETEIRMTLDRIDNDIGHTTGNVIPACIRCNYVRGNMPHTAWIVVARAMKRARGQGLFGDWTARRR